MENSKDPAFSSWEVEDALQRNFLSNFLLKEYGSRGKKSYNLIEYKQHPNESKISLWVSKETTWYLNWLKLSLQGQKVYIGLIIPIQVIAINNAAPTLPKPSNSLIIKLIYFHKDYVLLKYKY